MPFDTLAPAALLQSDEALRGLLGIVHVGETLVYSFFNLYLYSTI